jgi:two-component system, NarL family, invasion response regulator UvrY
VGTVPAVSLLLVDDQPTFRVAIRSMLEEVPGDTGFTVVGEAVDGEGAVALASALRPRVVLMDVRLPGIDGPEATRRILEHDGSIAVVLMSTARRVDLGADLMECGAVGFLPKEALDPEALWGLLGVLGRQPER